jgi:putative membrane protein
MIPHPNLTKTLLVLGLSACISTMPAQNTSTSGQANQSNEAGGQTTDRQSTRSGSNSADRNTTRSDTTTTSGDRSHAGQQGASADRNRTAGSSELMVNPTDQAFMMEAARSGLMEVQAATIAQQKAQSPEVKQFAQKLLDDHTKANQELQSLAAQKNVTLPTDMGPKHQAHIAKMQNLSDAQFDRQWMKMQVDHHKKDVREFQKEADRSMDSHVKAFATKTLPTLQEHLQTAQNLQQTATRSRSASNSSSSTSSNTSGSTSGSTSNATGKGSSSDTNNQSNNDATRKPQGQNNPSTQR